MTRNMLAVSKLRYRGTGANRMGSAKGRMYQLVEFGSKSGKKYRNAGYPVMVPPHVSMHSYVRKFKFGGAAKDAHSRAKTSGYSERKKYSRWRKPPAWYTRRSSVTANRRSRKSSRRSSMRRNQKFVVMKNGPRRGPRNPFDADLMKDVVTPVIGGTVGFVAARLLSNTLANVTSLRTMLDSTATSAATATNTKIAANIIGIAATLGLSTKVSIVKQHRGALVTGMGLALTDRLIQRFTAGSSYEGYLGEYVNQPMNGMGDAFYAAAGVGEYVNQPMNGMGDAFYAAAGVGEYVNQPMNGLGETMYATAGYEEGVDPASQGDTDGLMDVMEATAGMGIMQATAGMGIMQATAGMGEADSRLESMYARRQPPFASIAMPQGIAAEVTRNFPLEHEIGGSSVTPEARVSPDEGGKGYAGGLFARHLFAGMMGS
jgi:hypothetical protein